MDRDTKSENKKIPTVSLRRWLPIYAIVMPILVFLSWGVLDYFSRYALQVSHVKAQRLSNFTLAETFLSQLKKKPDPASVGTILQQFSTDPALKELVVYAPDNSIFSHVKKRTGMAPGTSTSSATQPPEFDQVIASQARQGGGTKFIQQGNWLTAYYAFQATQARELSPGYLVFLNYDLSLVQANTLRGVMRDALWPFFLVLIGSLLAVWFVHRFVNLPLENLVTVMKGFEREEAKRSLVTGSSELAVIAGMFNRGSARMMSLVEELRDREQYVERIFNSVAEGIIITDAAARVTRITPVAERLLGCRRDEVIGLPVDEIFRPLRINDRNIVESAAVLARESACVIELPDEQFLVSESGEERYITQTASPLLDTQGRNEGIFLTFRDVSEVYLARVERSISAVAFASDEPVIVADGTGNVLRTNSAAYRSGFYRDALEGIHLSELYRNVDNSELKKFLEHPGEAASCTGRTERVDETGLLSHLVETITAVRDKEGVLTHFVVTQRDISELVETSRALSESESRSRLLIQSMIDGVGLFDEQGCCTEFNRALITILGCGQENLIGKKISDFSDRFQPDGTNSDTRWAQLFESANFDAELEWQIVHPSGKTIDLNLSVVRVESGGAYEFLVTFHNITKRKERDERMRHLVGELRDTNRITRLAAIAGKVGIFDLDVERAELRWVEGTEHGIGFPEGMVGQNLDSYIQWMAPGDYERFTRAIEEGAESGEPFEVEQYYAVEGGEGIWVRVSGEVTQNSEGKLMVRGAVVNITAVKEAHLEAEKLAYYDPLTGLANRRLLLDRLQQACVQAERNGNNGAVLFLDLDHFKIINDSLGHKAGDAILQKVAGRLSKILREGDTVARLGGDEFVVILSELAPDSIKSAQEVENVAKKIIAVLGEPYELEGQEHRLGVSVGVALFPRDGYGAVVLARADAAMYRAKSKGRNTAAFYEPALQEQADARLSLENDLRTALELQQMRCYLQPQVGGDGCITGAEMLLRWVHPERGLVLPGEFIGAAEEIGLMTEFGEWMLSEACRQLSDWDERGLGLSIAVKIGAQQFKAGEFLETVSACRAEHKFPPGRLILEVTEGLLVENSDRIAEVLAQLKELGVKITIDHFGAGYFSLQSLQHIPVDQIKIDGRYIRDLAKAKGSQVLVETMIDLARNFDLKVIAEMVETQEQFEFLRARGCTSYQGYLFGKPVDATEFDGILPQGVRSVS